MKKSTFTLSLTGGLLFTLVQFTFSQSLKWTVDTYQYCCPIAGKYKDVAFDKNGNTFVLYEQFLDGGSNGSFLGMAFKKIDTMGYSDYDDYKIYVIDSSTALQGDYATAQSLRVDENGYIYASCFSPNYHVFIKLDNNLQLIFMKKFYDFVPVTSAVGFNSYYICGNTPDGAAVLRYNKNTGALQQFNQYENATVYDGEITNSGFAITGAIEGIGQGYQMFLQSYDSLLNLKWTYLYNNTNGNDAGFQMKVSGTNIYIAGTVGGFSKLLKINETGNLLWARKLISGTNLNSLKSLAVDAEADQAFVLTEQQRVIKYNSYGAQLFNRFIPLPTPSLGGMYNYITTDSRPGQMASMIILGGTNAYKKYYWNLPDSSYFRLWDQSVIRSLNVSNGATLSTDKFIIDCSYNYFKADYISFSTKLIKINSNVSPTQMVAIMDGDCNAPVADYYNRYGVARCFDLGNGSRHSNDNENLEDGITLYPNPAKDIIKIETSLENFTCSIFDLNGNWLISTEKISSGEELSIKSLKPGMYLISINDGTRSMNYKFIKSND